MSITSDHQLMPMTAANLQKVAETVGQVDAIFMAGDLVNVPDRASEWFDDARGRAFFPALQGRANSKLEFGDKTTVYRGGALLQSAPLYTAIGNHEVMGRYSATQGLNERFGDAVPRSIAAQRYESAAKINARNAPEVRETWIKENSFNSDTYEEIFTLPESPSGGEKYYAVTFGDIRLISLNDYIICDLEPLLNSAGVQLVYYGHSHVWNRFVNERGVNFLESSNVGNTYGAYLGQKQRSIPPELEGTYTAVGDPNGLKPIVPTLAPLTDNSGQSLPYISSNEISVFSIFDTGSGKVSSYRFDTRDPSLKVVKFDEFSLLSPPA